MNEAVRAIPCPIAQHAAATPDRVALSVAGRPYTWEQYASSVASTTAALLAAGIQPGSRIGWFAHTDYASCVLLPAIFRAGLVAVPFNPRFPDAYLKQRIPIAGCDVWLDFPGIPSPVPAECLRHLDANTLLSPQWDTLSAPAQWLLQRPATIVFTSGSMGVPKAAMHSLGNHRANAAASNARIPLTSESRWLLALPLFHVSGLAILFRCWLAGAVAVVPGPDEPLPELLNRTWLTHVSLVPMQLHRLMDDTDSVEKLRELQVILLGGAAAPESLIRRAHGAGLPICPTYGLTEMASQATTVPPGASLEERLGYGPPLLPGTVCVSAKGEIEIRGPSRFLGYVNGRELDTPFCDGFFSTGDLGWFDERDGLHVTGRADRRFVVGGENVQPETVEAELCAFAEIIEAVVVPVPDPEYGEVPVAFLRSRAAWTEDALRRRLAKTLPKYMIPRRIFGWPDTTPEGIKTSRHALEARAKELHS